MDNFQELHHRMCKKVAQLTKVIFFLNTKNDEYESSLRSVVQAYEGEMDILIKDANGIIQQYKDAIDQMGKNEELEKDLRNLQDKVQIEKSASVVEFNQYRKKCEEKEQQIIKESQAKMSTYQKEIDHHKNKFEELSRQIDKVVQRQEEMKKAHQKELSDCLKDSNDKYNALNKTKLSLEDQIGERDRRIIKMQKEIDELIKKVDEEKRKAQNSADKNIEEIRKNYEAKIDQLEDQIKSLKSSIEALETNVAQLKSKLSQTQNDLDNAKAEINQLKQTIQELTSTIQGLNSDLNSTRQQLLKEQGLSDTLQNDKLRLEKEVQDLKTTIQRMLQDGSSKDSELSRVRAQYEKQLTDMTMELQTQQGKYTELQKKYDMLGMELKAVRDAHDKNNNDKLKEIEKLKLTIEDLNSQIDKLKNQSKNQMGELERSLQEKIEQYEREKKDMVRQFEQTLADLERKNKEEMDRLRTSYEDQLTALREQHEVTVKRLTAEYDEKIRLLQKELADQKDRYENNADSVTKSFKDQIVVLERQLVERNKTIDSQRDEIESWKKKYATLQGSSNDLTAERDKLLNKVATLQQELERIRSEGSNRSEDMMLQIRQLQMQIDEQQLAHQHELDETTRKLRAQHEAVIQELKRDFERDRADLRNQFDLEMQQKLAEIARLKDEILRYQKQMEDGNGDWANRFRQRERDHEEAIKEINQRHNFEIQLIEEKAQQQRDQIKTYYEGEMSALRDELNREMARKLQAQADEFGNEKQKLTNTYEDKIQSLIKRLEAQMSDKSQEYETKLRELRKKYDDEINSHKTTKSELKDTKTSMQIDIDRLKDANSKKDNEITSLLDQVAVHRQQVSETKRACDQQIQEKDAWVSDMQRQLADREEEMKRLLNGKLKEGLKRQEDFASKLRLEFQAAQDLLLEKLQIVEKDYEDLQLLFEERPSRPEDIEAIKMLQAEVERKEDEIRKINEQFKFYKLELANRENNYNKMFNANPNVGVMDPLEHKKQQQAALANGTNNKKKGK